MSTSDPDFLLHKAAREGDEQRVKELLACGYHATATNFDSVTPLHEACLSSSYECLELLLDAGADVNARNIDGATPLCDAACSGSAACVRLLLERGADVNPKVNFVSPLHEAVLRDNYEVVKILIDAAASLEISDLHFGTALHVAAYKDFVLCGHLLLEAGANVDKPRMHTTALHLSALNRSADFVFMLLHYGANVYARNNESKLASDLVPKTSDVYRTLKNAETNPRLLSHTCCLVLRKVQRNMVVPPGLQKYFIWEPAIK